MPRDTAVVRYRPPVNAMDSEPAFQNADYAVTIKVRNGRFLKALRDAGYRTISSFCKAHALHQSNVGSYVTMIQSPFDKHGEPTSMIVDIADRLGTTVEALFPPRFLMKCLSKTARAEDVPMTEDQISMLIHQAPTTPEDVLAIAQAGEALSATIATLPSERQKRILIEHYGLADKEPLSIREMANKTGLSRARMDQLEDRAIERLKHPARLALLTDAAEALGVGVFRVIAKPMPDNEQADREQPEVQRIPHRKNRYQRPPPLPPKPPQTPPWVILLRIPARDREALQKLALAHHLEQLFAARGAGYMTPSDPVAAAKLAAMDHTTVQMAKYDWLMENLPVLFRHYPPEPDLSLRPWESPDPA